MKTGTSRPKVVLLFGPTAVGKTALLFNVFSKGFEVVNADSVQVYRRLDIGSAKATAEERAAVPHHLIDIREPWEGFSVGDFIALADEAAAGIRARGNVPVLCGGTAYYFKHFLCGLSGSPKSDPAVRARVQALIEEKGLARCHRLLEERDPASAARIHPHDGYRISRALEVCLAGEGVLSDYKIPTGVRNGMDVLSIGLRRPKEEMDRRITDRVAKMFDDGLVDEIKGLLALGASRSWPSMKAIGYQEFLWALETGEAGLDGIAARIASDSIRYAKRQRVFFNSFADVVWTDPDDLDRVREVVAAFLDRC